ncbi:MAG TPA: menaquinone biosynthesis protein [Terriglobia bacterium]|nr:menaquinone biosynthesis protein [Terriglobia bacterium]
MKPRISVVQYLNTAPLVWGMLHGSERDCFDLSFTTPACCAEDLRAGRAEVGIIPSIELQRIEGLKVLAGLSIASKRTVRSVVLLSRVPLERVRTVALDSSSRTSAALVEILFRRFYRIAPVAHPSAPDPEAMLRDSDAALLIGDPALVYAGDAQVFDLAAEWRRFTGLPFVFALWAVRNGAVAGDLKTLRLQFERSRDEGLAHVGEIAAEWGPRLGLEADAVRIYLTENIDYTLDEENLSGLRLFYELAHDVGAIPALGELDFA